MQSFSYVVADYYKEKKEKKILQKLSADHFDIGVFTHSCYLFNIISMV